MRFVEHAERLGIPMTWGTVRCAWEGMEGVPRLITVAEVQHFALQQVECASCDELTLVADLTSQDDHPEISRELAENAPEILGREFRVCRLLYVRRALEELPDEPIGGLMELTSLWGRMGYPEDAPHVVQGRGNNMVPAEYFTEENLRAVVDRHWTWVSSELAFVRS